MKRRMQSALLSITLGAAVVSALQGCVPVVVAGAGAGAMIANDRRTSGAYVDDEALEWKVKHQVNSRFEDRVNISVVSFNRVVLLTGQAPDVTTREELSRIASGNAGVRSVVNEVAVGPISSVGSRGNDAVITSKVKARFVDLATFGVAHVKVFTEAGTVFLMGLVTRKEGEAATEIARTTSGVTRVVKVFEYLGEGEAKNMDAAAAEGRPVAPPQ
ncbi:MAG: BON domain-containing protein [Zoogloeaceae bacterium]|nr:BON domain-containing protein [Zoogloeaceae bacterium]